LTKKQTPLEHSDAFGGCQNWVLRSDIVHFKWYDIFINCNCVVTRWQ